MLWLYLVTVPHSIALSDQFRSMALAYRHCHSMALSCRDRIILWLSLDTVSHSMALSCNCLILWSYLIVTASFYGSILSLPHYMALNVYYVSFDGFILSWLILRLSFYGSILSLCLILWLYLGTVSFYGSFCCFSVPSRCLTSFHSTDIYPTANVFGCVSLYTLLPLRLILLLHTPIF